MIDIPFHPAFRPFYIDTYRYYFAHGGRGGAKSQQIASILLIKGREQRYRILCAREVQKSIKDSVHVLLSDMINKYSLTDYQIKNTEIVNMNTGTEFFFTGMRDHTVSSMKSFEGIDYFWGEEAQAFSKKSMHIALPTIRKDGSKLIFSYNRDSEIDPVHELFLRELTVDGKKLKITVDGVRYPWVEYRGDNAIGLYINSDGNPFLSQELKDLRQKDYDTDKELYNHVWLGMPQAQGYYSLISRQDIQQAINRQVEDWSLVALGVDPARFGDDESVICIRNGFRILPFQTFKGVDTMRLTGEVIRIASEYYSKGHKEVIEVRVDDTGIGAGVVDRLTEKADEESRKNDRDKRFNTKIIPVIFNGKATDNKYHDFGTEIWGTVKDALPTMSIPDDKELHEQLATRKYKLDSDGRIRLESKDDMKKRGLHSPDRADALALCLAPVNNFDIDIKFEAQRI